MAKFWVVLGPHLGRLSFLRDLLVVDRLTVIWTAFQLQHALFLPLHWEFQGLLHISSRLLAHLTLQMFKC